MHTQTHTHVAGWISGQEYMTGWYMKAGNILEDFDELNWLGKA